MTTVMTLTEVQARLQLEGGEIRAWVRRRWVRPLEEGGDLHFDAADVARLQLIADLKRDLDLDDEVVPVVLDLLDQLYATRTLLRRLSEELAHLPEDTRHDIAARIGDWHDTAS